MKTFISAVTSQSVVRVVLVLFAALTLWNLYGLVVNYPAFFSIVALTFLDKLLYWLTGITLLLNGLSFLYIGVRFPTLVSVRKGFAMRLIIGNALVWLATDLVSAGVFMWEVPVSGIEYWYQALAAVIFAVVNPTLVCGYFAYSLESAGTPNPKNISMISHKIKIAFWVWLVTTIVGVALATKGIYW